MPELPEVETVVRDLREAGVAGLAVSDVRVYWPKSVAGLKPAAFRAKLAGARIEHVGRRGKYIVVELSGGGALLIHLRMTGQLRLAAPAEPRDPHEHIVLELSDGRQVRFRDTRKFGRWQLVDDPAELSGRLGPEPLDESLTGSGFAARLRGRRRALKPLLLDQTFLAGLGNIYVDEALWRAGLHPLRRSDSLSGRDAGRLLRAIRSVLTAAVERRGTSLGEGKPNFAGLGGRRGRNQALLGVFRRAGLPCPVCGAAVERFVVAQRGTHVCPRCQRRPV